MRVIAPSGAVPREAFLAGAAILGQRYSLVYGEDLFATDGYLAGNDARRLQELEQALGDPTVQAVVCARGGYGLLRFIDQLDLSKLARAPKVVVGFSDITVLHAALVRAGWVSVHGPVVTQLGRLPRQDVEHWFSLVENAAPPPPWNCTPLVVGEASGPMIGGNLELVTRLLGTPYLPELDGAVLALEEVGEQPYRIDRQLTQLKLAGVWQRVAAVVFGNLVDCTASPPCPPSAEEVVRERLGGLAIPVVVGAPFGHGSHNLGFPHGGQVSIDGARGTVTFLDGAVSKP